MTRSRPAASFWHGQHVLLTGHTGFKGAWAALWLNQMGARVTGASLPPETSPSLFELGRVASNTNSHLLDIRDSRAVRDLVATVRPDVVLHMAAQALVRRSYREPADTFASNVMGTVNILDAVRTVSSVKVCLVVTSDKVYENDGTGHAFTEQARLGGHDPYSSSKAATEIAVESYRRSFFETGTRVATARGGNVIGGGDFSEDRIVPDIWRAHRSNTPLVLRYPDATRPWQHVLDCVAGYLVFAEKLAAGTTKETALNFGPREGSVLPVKDLVKSMQKAIGATQDWQQAPGPLPKEMPALALSCARAEQTLGWTSALDPQATISWTADWYKALARDEDMRAATLRQINDFAALP